ncbi:flavodoxin domain-containing protein [Marinimicrobium alkaliphilum]|uniref:flavodoxin domain-containing protein n=1 Tax=Marinimicrobium alkaliphilum TaxID=2202654 RepID=UPI000DB9ABB8|nr:flavodoxin domain-containing protein [Marinimicrobium alkaliphilum]
MTSPLLQTLGILLGYAIFCAHIWRRHRAGVSETEGVATSGRGPDCLVCYASQNGAAERHARGTADTLRANGHSVRLLTANGLRERQLQRAQRVIFVVSTYGQGEPPDNGAVFARRSLHRAEDLPGLRFAVLALGDKRYSAYCAFGHALYDGLKARKAVPEFALVCVDREDPDALAGWEDLLTCL